MRSYRHLTPRYVVDRALLELYQRRNANDPWLAPEAIARLDTLILPTDLGLEWGSGRSTCWFAKRLKHLTSVDSNPLWFERVNKMIAKNKVTNVTYKLITIEDESRGAANDYVRVYEEFADESLGFTLVDGEIREFCAQAIIPKLAPGGLLVIDNINWFLDYPTRTPASRFGLGAKNENWAELHRQLADWRMMWISSGVIDTAIWIKPLS